MKSLAIVVTHPIQYYTPVFQQLAKHCRLKVFYTWGEEGTGNKYDPDFKQQINWDIPMLDGYDYILLRNTSKSPGSNHFYGIINPSLINEIESFKPNAILVYGWAYHSHFKLMRKLQGKYSIWFRGDSHLTSNSNPFREIARKLTLRFVYKFVDIAFYVGAANKRYFEYVGLKPKQLIFAPHAIDNDRFKTADPSQTPILRNSLNIPSEATLILFAGKFESNKDPLILLSAIKQLEIPNVHLLFLGNGVLEQEMKRLAEGSKNIHFHSFSNQSAIPVFYHSCDIVCLPSLNETWGLVINEGMAAGKAILVSDKVGCAEDLVRTGQNGFIFQAGNLTDLVDKLANLPNKEQLQKYGTASQELIKDWTFEIQSKAILDKLYDLN